MASSRVPSPPLTRICQIQFLQVVAISSDLTQLTALSSIIVRPSPSFSLFFWLTSCRQLDNNALTSVPACVFAVSQLTRLRVRWRRCPWPVSADHRLLCADFVECARRPLAASQPVDFPEATRRNACVPSPQTHLTHCAPAVVQQVDVAARRAVPTRAAGRDLRALQCIALHSSPSRSSVASDGSLGAVPAAPPRFH